MWWNAFRQIILCAFGIVKCLRKGRNSLLKESNWHSKGEVETPLSKWRTEWTKIYTIESDDWRCPNANFEWFFSYWHFVNEKSRLEDNESRLQITSRENRRASDRNWGSSARDTTESTLRPVIHQACFRIVSWMRAEKSHCERIISRGTLHQTSIYSLPQHTKIRSMRRKVKSLQFCWTQKNSAFPRTEEIYRRELYSIG
jgi:hypothetical protein